MAYLATWIGCKSARLDYISLNMQPPFHLQQMSQPAVNFMWAYCPLRMIFWSCSLRAEPFFLWSTNTSNKRYSFPLTSHWAYTSSVKEISPHSGMYPRWVLIGSTKLGYLWHHAFDIPLSLWPFYPLLEVISLCLHIGLPTLGLPLILHPKWGTFQHFVICPHVDHTAAYSLHPVVLRASTKCFLNFGIHFKFILKFIPLCLSVSPNVLFTHENMCTSIKLIGTSTKSIEYSFLFIHFQSLYINSGIYKHINLFCISHYP